MKAKQIIKKLKQVRKDANLSVYALRQTINVSYLTLTNYEKDVTRPPVDVLERWADALGYKIVLVKKDEQDEQDEQEEEPKDARTFPDELLPFNESCSDIEAKPLNHCKDE